MEGEVILRAATIDDAERLLQWRNDAATRAASREQGPVDPSVHREWVERVLGDRDRVLMIAEVSHAAVGTVRADRDDTGWKLSWTVSPDSRGRGYGKPMVRQFMEQLSGSVWAEIRVGNEASIRIAEGVGMALKQEMEGVRSYRLDIR